MGTGIQQAERGLLASSGAAGFKDLEANAAPATLLGEGAHRGACVGTLAGVDSVRGAMRSRKLQSPRIYINGNHSRAHCGRDLHAESPDSADADEDGDVVRAD